jgi:hypothetical protein
MSPYKSDDVTTPDRLKRIRELNDGLRRTFSGGKVMLSASVSELPAMVTAGALLQVRGFDAFDEDNDPHGEHDFGSFDLCQRTFFWKIDYYDKTLGFGSEDPAEPEKTTRILTLMLAEDY